MPDKAAVDTKRQERWLHIPVALDDWVAIGGRWPLSHEQWVQFKKVLDAMQPALTIPDEPNDGC